MRDRDRDRDRVRGGVRGGVRARASLRTGAMPGVPLDRTDEYKSPLDLP